MHEAQHVPLLSLLSDARTSHSKRRPASLTSSTPDVCASGSEVSPYDSAAACRYLNHSHVFNACSRFTFCNFSVAPVPGILPDAEEEMGLAQEATPGRITSRISKQPATQTSHLPLPERVLAEDVTLAAKVCFASFSRHVDLLEPLVEHRLAAAMRRVVQQEQSHAGDEDVPQPEDICGTMRSYQIQGLNWLLRQHRMSIGSILADEMGLGKTIQTIAFIAHLLRTQERPAPHLIVVPLSVLSNWGNEFKKFCPRVRVKRIHCYSGREAHKIFDEISRTACCEFDVVVTTYEVIKSRFWICKLGRMNWQTVVLDEGHRIKNESSLGAHHCSLLHTRFRLILTGTSSTPKTRTVYSC